MKDCRTKVRMTRDQVRYVLCHAPPPEIKWAIDRAMARYPGYVL